MRSFYATHKYIRVFVIGVPEGWHIGIYNLEQRKWTEINGCCCSTLREAKIEAETKATALTGKKLPVLKWH